MIGHLIAAEGICLAGKTSAINYAVTEKMPIEIVSECVRFDRNPPTKPTDYAEACSNDRYFINMDQLRWKQAREMQEQGKHVLAERCVLGTLSISYGYDIYFNSFRDTAEYFISVLDKGVFCPPTSYIWFQVGADVVQDRLEKDSTRVVKGFGMTNPEALERQNSFLCCYFDFMDFIPIYIVDANQNEVRANKEFAEHIWDILQTPVNDGVEHGFQYRCRMKEFLNKFLRSI